MNSDEKARPFCGETIKAVAKKCKHCGEWLLQDVSAGLAQDGEVAPPQATPVIGRQHRQRLHRPAHQLRPGR